MKKILFVVVACSLISNCGQNNSEFFEILKIEDQRQDCAQLSRYLNDAEPKIRRRALEAMGRLQDSTCISEVADLLLDINPNVRIEAAFALGQLGGDFAEEQLITVLKNKDMNAVKGKILEALGKIGGTKSFAAITEQFKNIEANVRAEAALAVGRLAYRDIRDSVLTAEVTKLLSDHNAVVRWKSAYALMRVAKDIQPGPLRRAVEDTDPRVRMHAVLALGKLKDYTFIEPLGRLLSSDPDWRVRVKAAAAFANYPLSISANYLTLLYQPQPVRVAIIQAIGQSALVDEGRYRSNSRELNFAKVQLESVFQNRNSEATQAEKGEALVSYARLMGTKAFDTLLGFSRNENVRLRARAIEGMGEVGSRRAFKILREQIADSTHSRVKIAALQALEKIGGPGSSQIYLAAMKSDDPILVALGAEGLAKEPLKNRIYAKKIFEAYDRVKEKMDAETANMIFMAMAEFKTQEAVPVLRAQLTSTNDSIVNAARKSLQALTGELEIEVQRVKQSVSLEDFNRLSELAQVRAFLETRQGTVEIKLLPEYAPLTVLNFVKLAEEHYFDGLTFHRVVPNFVVQAGDQRGDGWGSPGYAIRSEFNKLNYERGMVGMASAGKDTEGSQFFITHSAQPHLDGRYTIFGKVLNGMPIIDKIQEDDIIETIRIQK